MADITRISRFVGGLPRDVDLTENSLHVLSVKVGTTDPYELNKDMATLLGTIYNPAAGLPAANLSAGAKQATLESKLAALRVGVLAFEPTTGNTSDIVTLEVQGAAAVDTPIGAGAGISSASAKGIFVGTVSGSADIGKVLIRVNGTDNGFDDGTGDEIYGVLSESGGVFTLSYKTAAGGDYTIQASDTTSKFDFYFIEVMDLYSFGVDRLLMPAIGGVVDATTASSVYAESSARIAADNAEITARQDADSTLTSNLNTEITARQDADSTLTSNLNIEITARQDADSTLTSNLNIEITARQDADSTLTSNLNIEITARQDADSTLQANLNSEITARMAADSSLQTELDVTQASIGDAINGDGSWSGFDLTNYLDAELTITEALKKLDETIGALISNAIDVSFVAATGGISAGDVVALNPSVAGEVIKANASAIATCESVVGVAMETKSAGAAVLVRTFGEATVTGESAFDVGKRVYAFTSAGQATKTAPSTLDNVVYLIGGATAANKVFVNTNLEYVVN